MSCHSSAYTHGIEGYELFSDESKKKAFDAKFRESASKILDGIDVSISDLAVLHQKTAEIGVLNELLASPSVSLTDALSTLNASRSRQTLLMLLNIVEQFRGPILNVIEKMNNVSWDGQDLAGFVGAVFVMDLTQETRRGILTHAIFAAALYSISMIDKDARFFCIRLAEDRTMSALYFKFLQLKSNYRCLSLRAISDEISDHLPVMISSRENLDKYFAEAVLAQELEQDLEMLMMM